MKELANEPTIYEDGTYLARNANWHVEDSLGKALLVHNILARNGLAPRKFVEVGCGAGAILTELASLYPRSEFDGYDISPQASELSRGRATERIHFHHGDFLKTEGKFDCLLAMDVFEHVPDYLGFLRALVHRADYAVFHIPMDLNVVSLLRGHMLRERADVGHLHYFNRDTALATLKDCGYEIVDEGFGEWFRRLPRPSLKNKITGLVYQVVFNRRPRLAVDLFGDCSLIALARVALSVER